MIKTRWMGMAAAALLAACGGSMNHNHDKDQARAQMHEQEARSEGRQAVRETGHTGVHIGQATVNAGRAAVHGTMYGVRELGQTMSGTQGNPSAEARSREQRELTRQSAHNFRQDVRSTGESGGEAVQSTGAATYHGGAAAVNATRAATERNNQRRGSDGRIHDGTRSNVGGGPVSNDH